MTGGTAHAQTINTNIAIAAEKTGVAMGVGSQRIALELDDARESFALVRDHAPTAVVFANLGAVQLNYGRGVEDVRRIIDMVQADGLYLHLNPLQEALQPEGDTNFAGLLDKIGLLIKEIDVPVFVKEVGHGIDMRSAQALIDHGVAGIDCAGVGGTSWAWVEAKRSENSDFQEWFKSVGIPTDLLLEQYQQLSGDVTKVVSGGVRTPIEVLKARALGADLYSMAQPFLAPALESSDAVETMINNFEQGLKIAMFVCGVKDWRSAKQLKLVTP
jgi:isopentenyl-diphosphate Delta-isomerase